MATNVILPALGIAQDTGKIIEWLKAEGDTVTEGEPLVVVETDKAAVDLESPASGVLARVSAAVGDEVPVARVIAVILSPSEAANAAAPEQPSIIVPSPQPIANTSPAATAVLPSLAATPSSPERNGRRAASPKARRIAEQRGVNLAALHGSGPGGVVLAADVLAAATAHPPTSLPSANGTTTAPRAVAHSSPPPAHSAVDGVSSISSAWRLMAERTTASWTSVPHFFLVREVNASPLIAWRERALRQGADGVTYTDLLVAVVAEALRLHPRVNARWENGTVVTNDAANIGIAVATESGLVVPVIHGAEDLSLRGITKQRADLVARAQASQLRLRDLQDGTFTISNLGMYGIDAFNAIINAPQAAILAVGRIADRVVPHNGQPIVQPRVTLTLSCDHRVVDGALGARFLATVANLIEESSSSLNRG